MAMKDDKTCSVTDCGKVIASRDMCDMHRAREARSGRLEKLIPQSPEQRFSSKVQPGPGCWAWTGATNNRGYGVFRLDGRTQLAHRVAWYFEHGAWPDPEKVLDHACDNKACVNLEHLRELTNGQNIMRAHPRGDEATERRRALNRTAKAKYRAKLKAKAGGSNSVV
ncbi:HNH endonuclease signature motif containing protein [Pseudarthrobacter sp. alpha12b]